MTTATLQHSSVEPAPAVSIPSFKLNPYAAGAGLSSLLFLGYFILPHVGVLHVLFRSSLVYVIFLPLLAFILSIVAIRQVTRSHEKGKIMSYAALGLSSLYLIVGLAIPFVLIGYYILYVYILR